MKIPFVQNIDNVQAERKTTRNTIENRLVGYKKHRCYAILMQWSLDNDESEKVEGSKEFSSLLSKESQNIELNHYQTLPE